MSEKQHGNVSAINDYIDDETIDNLERLLADARAGKIIGLVFASAGKNTLAEVGVTGACHTDPLVSLGMIRMLEDLAVDSARGTGVPPLEAG